MTYPELRLAMFWAEETQDDIAKFLGVNKGNLSRRFNHKLNFTSEEKRKLAKHYKIPMKKLFKED